MKALRFSALCTHTSQVLTLQVADTHSIQQHHVFMGYLSHHVSRLKEGLLKIYILGDRKKWIKCAGMICN